MLPESPAVAFVRVAPSVLRPKRKSSACSCPSRANRSYPVVSRAPLSMQEHAAPARALAAATAVAALSCFLLPTASHAAGTYGAQQPLMRSVEPFDVVVGAGGSSPLSRLSSSRDMAALTRPLHLLSPHRRAGEALVARTPLLSMVDAPVDALRVDVDGAHVSLGERVASALRERGISDELVIVAVSAMPVVELRAGIPIGCMLGLHPLKVMLLAVVGNMAPIVPLLLLLRVRIVQTLAARMLDRARRKALTLGTSGSRAKALALFVGVPLPGTGAWTGSVVAFILGMPFGQAVGALFAGVVIAASIMTALCALGKTGAALAAVALLGFGSLSMVRGATQEPRATTEAVDLIEVDDQTLDTESSSSI